MCRLGVRSNKISLAYRQQTDDFTIATGDLVENDLIYTQCRIDVYYLFVWFSFSI